MQANPKPLSALRVVSFQSRPGMRLHVLQGRIWVTQTHDLQDHFLHAQQSLDLQPGHVVIEADEDSQYTLRASSENTHNRQDRPLLWHALWARWRVKQPY